MATIVLSAGPAGGHEVERPLLGSTVEVELEDGSVSVYRIEGSIGVFTGFKVSPPPAEPEAPGFIARLFGV